MNRIFKKVFAATLLTGFVILSGLVTIILFPKPLFAHKLEHGQFNVYSTSEVDVEMKFILDDAADLVRHSELYDREMQFDVYLSYNTIFNTIDDALIGSGPSARATNYYVTFKVAVDAKRNLFFPTYYRKCEGNLTYLLAHEIVHVLQETKYGKVKFNPFNRPEYWKLEGYPEYIARRPARLRSDYDLVNEIDKFIELESKLTDIWISIDDNGCKAPKYYYKGRLMTEYLMDIRQLTYHEILADTTSEDSIYAEMVRWSKKDNQNKKKGR